jgi:uncharacterized protein YecT (DUF1311 family)
MSVATPKEQRDLRAQEREWMAERDKTCDATKIAVFYAKLCVMEMTATRADESNLAQ